MRTRTRNLKRLLSLALCLCMVTGLLPAAALAADAPAITTESLANATMGEEYTATLRAEASDQNGTLTWSSEDLPAWLTLTGSGETAVLTGTPDEAGEVTFTVTVTESIPAAQPEEPAEGTEPDQGTEPEQEPAPAESSVLTASKEYTLTVVEAMPVDVPDSGPGVSLLSIAGKRELSFNLYLQPESGEMIGQEDKITQFSIANELFLTVDNYLGTNPTKIALISNTLDVANLDETNLNNNALILAVGGQNGAMTAVNGQLVVDHFRTVDSAGSVPVAANGISTLNDGGEYRFLVWDGADSENQTVYYSSNTYTYTAANTIDMTVTRDGQSVTSFANTDTITITATLPTAPSSIGSIFFGEQYMYLAPDSVQTSGNTVTITMNGLYTSTYGEKRDPLAPGSYKISFWDDIEKPDGSYDSIEYVSAATYTVTGEGGTPTITTATLPEATVGVSYETTLTATPATGGTLSWDLASGSSLPAGLTLGTDGKLSGIPTAPVSGHAFTVQVTETPTDGGEALTATKQFTLTVKEPAGPTINTTSLPLAFLGQEYQATLEANAGSGGSLSWSITSVNKPDWLTLNENTGALSGNVPNDAATESVSLTFQVTETLGGDITRTAETTLTLTVTQKLEITNTPTSFNPARGEAFSLTLEANLEGVTWSRESGYLPSGLQFNSSNGTISGTVSASARDGAYTYTVTASSPDGQTAEQIFTFTVGSLFSFTLPDGLDTDAIGRYASLRAMLDGKQVTLWNGYLTGLDQTLTVNSAYAGKTVTDVKLTIYVARGDVTLATAGSTDLTDGDSAALAAENNPIVTLPAFTYGGLDNYVSAWFEDDTGYRYYSGGLAERSRTFTLEARASDYQYRNSGDADYDLSSTPSFGGNNDVSGGTYTPSSGDGSAITVAYPPLTQQTVTFTLEMLDGASGTTDALSRASLSIYQCVNGNPIWTEAQVENNTTATAELYTGLEANLSLLNAPRCYLLNTKINQIANTNELTWYTSEHSQSALLIAPKLAADAGDNLLTYANNLTGSKLSPTMTVNGDSWEINSIFATMYVGRSTSSRVWDCQHAESIATLATQGASYSLSWPAHQGILAGELENQTWPYGQLNASAEVTINLKGGVLLTVNNTDNSSVGVQDWWYQKDANGNGTWITSGNPTTLRIRERDYSFYCPGDNGTYHFLLLPKETQPIGLDWDQALRLFGEMPHLEDVNVANNTVTTGTFTVNNVKTAAARYLTLPNSTLTGPAQFSTTNELLSFTGGIQLDDGMSGKMSTLRIDASGTDSGGRVAFQISSVQINGKTYPYAGIHLTSSPSSEDTLMSEQFTTYYEINFTEPISLPCTFTIYGTAMTANSDVKLSPSVKLTGVTGGPESTWDEWQPLGTVITQAPALSVSVPSIVGTEVFSAYLTIPGGDGRVDIYDGETLVVSSARAGEVMIPLVGTSPSRTTAHNLSFRWNKKPSNASDEPYEVTVLHINGVPTLVSQQLQSGTLMSTNNYKWETHERDRIYSFASASPPLFRAICTIENSENTSGQVTFLFYLLDGTFVTRPAETRSDNGNGDTFTSKTLRTSSPVISVSILFDTNWEGVEKVLQSSMPSLPADSPSRDMTNVTFTETVVIPYEEHNIQFSQLPTEFPETSTEEMPSRQDLWKQIQKFQKEIEEIYEENDDQARFYIIDIGTGQFADSFLPAGDMINELDTGYIPQGDTGTTTMTRPLTQEQLQGELGSGEWSRYSFTEPGANGGEATTGMEIYTQSVTTGNGVEATITIATDGRNTVEFAMARGEGTGTNSYTLPDSNTYSTDSLVGQSGFSFTNFGSDGMSVFTELCGDVTTGSNTIKDITAAITGAEATGIFKPLEQGLGAFSFTKDMMDGMNNELTLVDLLNAPNGWLASPCAQKLPANFRQNMQNQINQLIKDVRDAEGWNMAVTGANYVLGAGGMVGMFSNPFTATLSIIGGAASWCAGKITSQKITNVQQQATLLKDIIDMRITKMAIETNDPNCIKKGGSMDRTDSSTSSYRVCIDPSGIVYEAVLSNPVEGATVTLYTDGINYTPTYETAKDENNQDTGIQIMVGNGGKPIAPKNASDASGAKLTAPEENSTIPAETVLTTGTDGRFQWMVEQGLWYVTAYKEGYQPGNSGNDVAAVVEAGSLNWLPVAPEQLNVNIPLVSNAAPKVTVEARSDGVYLTFSKYMDNTTLTAGNFTLTDSAGQEISITDVELLNSEKAPSNIDYDGDAPWYTSQVKLAVNEVLSGDVTVTIAETVVSYAGVPCGSRTVSGEVREGDLVTAPTINGGGQVAYGSTVTITNIPEGAAVYYTTDGTEPSFDSSGQPTGTTIRYYAGQPIVITRTMTLKAVAVKYGVRSEMVPATFTVSGTGGDIPGGDDTPVTPVNPGGSSGSYDDSGYSVSVPAASSIRGGSITVSPRSADKGDTVTITVKPDSGYELSALTVTDSKGKEVALTDKGNGKYTFTMPGSNVKIEVSFKEIAEQVVNPFTDVYESDYYYDAVLWAVANGVTAGTSATTFSPNAPVTRAQMVTFLWRAYGSPKATGSNPFADVSADAWYYDAVLWAVANGVTNGTSATTFSPDAPVTRSQAVTFQWRAAGSPVVAGDSFDDVAADAYYAGAVTWAVANGITNGTGGNKFSPEVTVTRAQAVTFLWRELA